MRLESYMVAVFSDVEVSEQCRLDGNVPANRVVGKRFALRVARGQMRRSFFYRRPAPVNSLIRSVTSNNDISARPYGIDATSQ